MFRFLRFEGRVEGLRDWLEQMERSLKREHPLGGEEQPGVPDSTDELERVEEIHRKLLTKRFVCVVF